MERHDLTLWVDDEFGPAPRDHLGLVFLFVKERTISAQELIDRVSLWSIDINLWKHGELDIVFCGGPFFDRGVITRFLFPKLVGGEGKNLETLLSVLLMELNQFFVVLVRQASLAYHIDDQCTLLAINQFA